jgi:hypothetical protein
MNDILTTLNPGKYDALWVVRSSIKLKETWNGMKYHEFLLSCQYFPITHRDESP